MVVMGDVESASDKSELSYGVRGEAREVDLVPKMRENIPPITGRFAKEGYVSVYDK